MRPWFAALILLWVGSLGAQEKPVIGGADLGRAQTLVDTLTKENETLKSDSARLSEEAAQLQNRITQAYKAVDELVSLLAEAKARYADLAALSPTLVDRALVEKARVAAEKNRDLIKTISLRIDALNAAAAADAQQLRDRLSGVSVAEARWARNTEDLLLLDAMLSRTKIQEAQVAEMGRRLDELSARAGSFLQAPLPARP